MHYILFLYLFVYLLLRHRSQSYLRRCAYEIMHRVLHAHWGTNAKRALFADDVDCGRQLASKYLNQCIYIHLYM